jgi:hypothetical protein
MTDIAIKVEILTEKDMLVDYYNIDTNNLNLNPLEELKTLETLIKALRIFEDTNLYGVIGKGIEIRLARLLAYFEDKVRPK